MTLTQTVDRRTIVGNMRMLIGHCTSDGTGGDVTTGLREVETFFIQHQDSSVEGNAPVVNETLPLSGGDVTVVTDSGKSFTWMAIGR